MDKDAFITFPPEAAKAKTDSRVNRVASNNRAAGVSVFPRAQPGLDSSRCRCDLFTEKPRIKGSPFWPGLTVSNPLFSRLSFYPAVCDRSVPGCRRIVP